MMNPREEELFGILQEEAAESIEILARIIKIVSKRRRFGKSERNIKELETELGDFFAVLKLLVNEGYISMDNLEKAAERKLDKLAEHMTNPLPVPAKSTKD